VEKKNAPEKGGTTPFREYEKGSKGEGKKGGQEKKQKGGSHQGGAELPEED